MKNSAKKHEISLVEAANSGLAGKFGGFSFGGEHPIGVSAHNQFPPGVTFPNGARAALLLTFDVEGNYGNGLGNVQLEMDNYRRICASFKQNGIPATFNIVAKMVEDNGPDFAYPMVEANCEIASHGYYHDLYHRHGGNRIYAGQYGPEENRSQVFESLEILNKYFPEVKGVRLPYGHFNEHSYDAFEAAGLLWSSNVGIDDFIKPGQGFGPAPFQMKLGDKLYPIVEIPLDSQTYDWSIWMADAEANKTFVDAVQAYCDMRGMEFVRTPAGGVKLWEERMKEAIEKQSVFSLLCHPVNLAVNDPRWHDPVEEFLMPVIDLLGKYHHEGRAWVCTCRQLAEFYLQNI